jgi:hypothetical protein
MHFDPKKNAALVAVLVAEIRFADVAENDILLDEFLRTAWPTRRSQYQ